MGGYGYRTPAWTLLVWLLAVGCAGAQISGLPGGGVPPKGDDALMGFKVLQERSDRLVVELPNRLIVIAQEVDTAPVVSAQVWIKTGSIYEQEHVGAGLSHFLEHLLSGGSTSTRTEAESTAILGAIGGQTNAATGLDTVRYYINATSDHTEVVIDLLSDWMQHSLITPEEYARERGVIEREFESGQGSPGRIFWKLTQQARFRVHPARHPTIGYLDEFKAVTRDQIFDFYKRMYVPNNMLFVVAGDIDKQKVVQQISDLWSKEATGALPELGLPIEPIADEPRQLSGTASIHQPKLRLAWPGTRLAAEHDYALDLLAVALGQGESSRLVRIVRDRQRAADTIGSYNWSMQWGEGFFAVDADVAALPADKTGELTPEQAVAAAVERAKGLILEQVASVCRDGITESELARAKRKVLADAVRSGQDVNSLAGRLASDMVNMGDPDYLTRYAQAIQEVTNDQVVAAARKFLTPDRSISVTLLPSPKDQEAEALTRPDDPQIENLKIEQVVLDNSSVLDRFGSLSSSDVQPAAAVEIGDIEHHVLPNGLRLLVQRNTLVPVVAMQMYSLGGLLSDEPGREGVAAAVAAMIKKGTANRSADQIARRLEDLGAVLGASGGNNTSYVQAECLAEDWPVVMELLADVALRPSFPAEEWQKLRPRIVAAIARQDDSWHGELRSAFRKSFFGDDHPWSQATLGRADVIEEVTAEQLRSFHRDHLGASQTVLAVFGDVEVAEVVRRVEALFAEMPAAASVVFDAPQPPLPEALVEQVKTAKPLAAVQIGLGPRNMPGATRRSPDYPALTVLAKVMSDFPAGWLEAQLRGSQGDGLAYAVWSYQFSGMVPGCFVVGYNTEPAKVQESLKRTFATIDRARNSTIDDKTLARAKAAVLSGEFLGKQSNSDRAADAALNELYDLPANEPELFLAEVQRLDSDMLQIVARMYLRNPVVVVLTNEPADADTLAPIVGLPEGGTD